MTDEESVDIVEELREAIVPPAGYTYQLTGYGPITLDSAEQSEKDLAAGRDSCRSRSSRSS